MSESTTIEGLDDTRLDLRVYTGGKFLGLDAVYSSGMLRSAVANIPFEQAHALADWIIANVPKPEPVPLPTKLAAVVRAGESRWALADGEEPKWLELNSNGDNWRSSDWFATEDFEVIYAGVED